MPRVSLSSPLVLAALVTIANAAKPVTVDDTAYLLYARHVAHNPADPYGFSVFWWSEPEPAMGVLCPPVVPYWLAAGVAVFGESPALLKLWLFPFVYLLAWALRALLVRFARGTEGFALPLLMLSPAVLPTVNLMLDIPAVALALATVEVFARGRWRHALVAGALAALAMQAKYSAFVAPAVIVWYGLAHRRLARAAVAVAVCAALFASWELWLVSKYGESHFWRHAAGTAEGWALREAVTPPPAAPIATATEASSRERAAEKFAEKLNLIPPLVGQLGCLAIGAGLLALSAVRAPRWRLAALAGVWWAGFALVAVLPQRYTAINQYTTATTVFWESVGAVWLLGVGGGALVLLFRVKAGLAPRLRADAWFLAGWLVLECGAAVALSPFAAARRVIGVALVAGLLAARLAGRVGRARPERRAPRWVLAAGICAGVAVAALDTFDAFPEKVCAERAAEVVRDREPGARVWYVGHWGFQYYCERAGFEPLVPGRTTARAGDFVVLPVYPEARGFFRPYPGFDVPPPRRAGDVVAEVWWDDWLSAQTVPNLYGGTDPVAGRDHPRLRVRVWKLHRDWSPR